MLRRVGWEEADADCADPGMTVAVTAVSPVGLGAGERRSALGRVVPDPGHRAATTGHPSGAWSDEHAADLASRSVTIRCASASVPASRVPSSWAWS